MNRKDLAYWACQIAGWGGYSLISCLFIVNAAGAKFSIIFGYLLFAFYSMGLTHLLRREIHRRSWLKWYGRLKWELSSAVFLISTVQAVLVVCVSLLLDRGQYQMLRPTFLLALWGGMVWVTGVWTLLYVFISGRRRELQLKLALREARLRAIEAQIDPHFLFNCLNSIRAMVIENPPRAQDVITRLSNLLRHNLKRGESSTVPLSGEIEAVSDYLAIESVRFEDRLRVSMAIDPKVTQFPVPAMMLQTLVENAIKHGIATRPKGGEIAIKARGEGHGLFLQVVNTGQLCPGLTSGTQIGLANVRERLRILYDETAVFRLANTANDQVAATVTIPRVS